MRSTVGPSRTSRPRSANGSMRKGWTKSSDLVSASRDNKKLQLFNKPRCHCERSDAISHHMGESDGDCFVAALLAMTSRASADAPGKDALLDMQPVFRLVPHHRLRTVDNRGGHLLAALRRQAVHKYGVGLGLCHQALVDAVRGEQIVPADIGLHPHRDPGVGYDAIGAGHRLVRFVRPVVQAPLLPPPSLSHLMPR